ncbi:MAG: dockerin type I domain-containing protein [Bacilli bacterium]
MKNILVNCSEKKNIVLVLSLSILLLLFIIIRITYANPTSNFQFDIECKNSNTSRENIYVGDDIVCNVFGNVKSNNVSGVDTSIVVDRNLKLNSDSISVNEEFINNDDFLYDIDKDNNSVIILEANNFANVTSDKVKLITFKVNALQDIASTGNIKLVNTTIVSNDVEFSISDYSEEVTISKLPEAAYLTSLTVDDSDIFNFKSDVFSYDSKVINKDKVNIKATVSEGARIKEEIGDMILNYGNNEFKITVISSTDVETVYSFSIYRPYSSVLLKNFSILVNDKNIELDKSLDSQNVTVNSNSIEIIANGMEGSTISGNGIKNLNIGDNIFEILVISEDETNTKKYILNVYRQNTDTSIKDLYVNDNIVNVEENNTYNYNVNALNFNIKTVLNDVNADYKLYKIKGDYREEIDGNNIKIDDGSDNVFEIVVLAEDGVTSENYTLNIHELSSDSYLQSLTIDNLGFNFDKNILEYNLNTELDEINISAISSNENSTISGIGKKILELGNNSFNIIVTAEDNSTRTYTLNVNKVKMEDNKIIFNGLTVNEDKNYIYKIEVGTSIDTIINSVSTNGKVSVIRDNDISITATGQKLKIDFDDYSVEYIIIVKGDVNGDGKVTLSDITTALKGYRKKIDFTDYMFTAIDFNDDGEFKLSDIVSHLKYYKNNK